MRLKLFEACFMLAPIWNRSIWKHKEGRHDGNRENTRKRFKKNIYYHSVLHKQGY